MHNRAHPRHYRSEYLRGYLHRQADVYSLPGWSQLVIPYIYRVNEKTTNTTDTTNTTVKDYATNILSVKLSEVVSVISVFISKYEDKYLNIFSYMCSLK